MRIAFSGSHRVGKSTLVAQVAQALPRYATVDEPYHLLEEDGYEFDWPLSAEDSEVQLDRSVIEIKTAGTNVLFDRCPADLLAYLLVDGQAIEANIEHAREALQLLDLVVFVPIEEPERIPAALDEDRDWRHAVHEALAQLLLDDELVKDTLTVQGNVTARVAQVRMQVDGVGGLVSPGGEG